MPLSAAFFGGIAAFKTFLSESFAPIGAARLACFSILFVKHKKYDKNAFSFRKSKSPPTFAGGLLPTFIKGEKHKQFQRLCRVKLKGDLKRLAGIILIGIAVNL